MEQIKDSTRDFRSKMYGQRHLGFMLVFEAIRDGYLIPFHNILWDELQFKYPKED